jgi:hypothetical protein
VDGVTQKSFATSENFRLTYRIDLYDARAVEIGIPVRPAMAVPVVRLSRSGAAVLGTRSGGDFTAKGEAVTDVLPKDSRGVFHEVRLDKIGSTWHVAVNGRQVGSLSDVETNPRVATVTTEGGEVRIESVKRDDLGRKTLP